MTGRLLCKGWSVSPSHGRDPGALLVHNYLRFEAVHESATSTSTSAGQERMQRWGLVQTTLWSRNLTCALLLLPRILTQYPYLKGQRAWHVHAGDTPALGYTVAPRSAARWRPACGSLSWSPRCPRCSTRILVSCSRLPLQPGPYIVFWSVLLAVAGRKFSWLFKTLIVFGVAVKPLRSDRFRSLRRNLRLQR